MVVLTAGASGIDFANLKVSDLLLGDVTVATPTAFTLKDGAWLEEFTGSFTYSGGNISGGTVNTWHESFAGQTTFQVTGFSVAATTFVTWAATDNNETAKTTILAGDDQINGSAAADRMFGYSGNDTLVGGGGQDYLRGDDGNDSIHGGSGFDDINGNKGDDTIDGGSGGGDWLVGGQGNDLITAHASGNILYGNIGSDTLNGGADAEILRGGQGDDLITAGAGADWVSGDRGNDTLTGGAGADIFHTFNGAGVDRVTDFSLAEGDRVQLDSGTTYTVTQVGADTVIDMGNGDQMVLVGVQSTGLPPGWIFGA